MVEHPNEVEKTAGGGVDYIMMAE